MLLVLGGLLVPLVLLLVALWVVQSGQVLPNTRVLAIEIGGMDDGEVRQALRPLLDAREDTPITMTFQDQTLELDPDEVEYDLDVDATVERAMSRGRTGLPGDAVTRVRSLWTERAFDPVETWDDERLDRWVASTADGIDREETPGDVRVDPETLEVSVEMPAGFAEVDRVEMRERIVDALLDRGPREFDLPAETTPQPVPDDAVEAVADQARRAVEQPLELVVDGASLTVERPDLARLISVEPTDDGADLELLVTEEAIDEVLTDRASEAFNADPRSASYSTSRGPPRTLDVLGDTSFSPVQSPVQIEPAASGRRFAPAQASEQLTELLREGSRSAELRMQVVEPDLTTEQAEQNRPTHLIGTFTTHYQAGQTRNQNIQRLADVIDGTTVFQGEQFSINEISGERSCDKGYEPAGTIVRGELVDTCGGGTSQFGTTTMNAAFFAGVQLDDWQPHSWYISRYPMGREATLNYPYLDVRFTNDTSGVILVKTSHTSTSVTVSIYGQPVARQVTARHGDPHDHRDFDTETRTDSSLSAGQENVLQSGSEGFRVQVERIIERTDGSTDTQTLTHTYSPQTRIVERGTGS